MLKKLKEMQQFNVFKLQPYDIDLDTIIAEAKNEEDIKGHLEEIKDYVKELDRTYSIDYNVPIGTTIYDFNDKFSYELFEIYLAPINAKTGIHHKETSFGRKCGNGYLGLSSSNTSFNLLERKLLKIVNHYYINLKGMPTFKDNVFYIPMKQLARMFTDGINKNVIKSSIIDTIGRLNEKKIYYDLSKTYYCKSTKDREMKIKDRKLHSCNGEPLLALCPFYQPRGKYLSLTGIVCKVNKLMQLRYTLKQISSYYPSALLSNNYLSFVIASKMVYHMNMKTNKKKGYIKKELSSLLGELYEYNKDKQLSTTYLKIMRDDRHKPREQLKLLSSLVDIAAAFATNGSASPSLYLLIDNKKIRLIDKLGNPRTAEEVYNDIFKILSTQNYKGDVLSAIIIGRICFKVSYKDN